MASATLLDTATLALVFDELFGEPPAAVHPVVGMGALIGAAERCAPRADAWAQLVWGAGTAAGGMLLCGAVAAILTRTRGRLPRALDAPLRGLLLKSLLAWRALETAALDVASLLEASRLHAARRALRALVSRETAALEESLVAAAAVESVAENLSDSVVAPLVWYAVGGLPAAVAYRFANTCDAMLGYRGRYEYLGKVPARLDDLANWLPARLTAGLLVLAAGCCRADARGAWHIARRDHARTASPNAGWPMSAMAGALGVRLEKRGHYVLGDGAAPSAGTIRDAVRLARHAIALLVCGLAVPSAARRACASAA